MPDSPLSGADAARDTTRSTTPHRNRRRRTDRGGARADRPRDRRQPGGPAFGAIDLGTNNCRLLVAHPAKGARGIRVVDSYSDVVRLGEGLATTGRLSDRAMDATVAALHVCKRKMERRDVKAFRAVATQACRQAENGAEFIARVREEVGIRLEVISPRVEARLSVMGCLTLADPKKQVALVVDIGGGSTELSWLDVKRLKGAQGRGGKPPINAWASLPVGVATLSEMHPEHGDRVAWYSAMKDHVRQAIAEQGCGNNYRQIFRAGKGHIIGTSGTITSLAGVHLKLPYYQRKRVDGIWMPTADAVNVARDLASRDFAGRASVPSIGADRAQLLVAGCAIMDVLCEMWPGERIRVADRGLREGILLGLMNRAAS